MWEGLPSPLYLRHGSRGLRPTAFGKTITAAAMIARRKVSTLVMVHRTELLRQWVELLTAFLELAEESLGAIGGGKHEPTGKIDIAVMQSLSKRDDLLQLLDGYGQVVIDECHHLSAVSFEAILKEAKTRHVVGLTATPVRRDGRHPIIFILETAVERPPGCVRRRVWQGASGPVDPVNRRNRSNTRWNS